MKSLLKVIATMFLLLSCLVVSAEEKDEAEAPKTIAELTENHARMDGLITLLQDQKTGKLKLLLDSDLLGKELIYFAQASDGVVQTGYFRGAFLANGVVMLRRHFDTIEVVALNTSFYFDPDSALSRASRANISESILATQEILAEDEASGEILIEGDALFVSEAMLQIKPSADPDANPKAFKLGSLSESKSKLTAVRSYPENTDIEVEYVYSNAAPIGFTGGDVTDQRNVSVRILHSLIAMPDNDYVARLDDPRVGYFFTQVTDLTSFSPTPYRDLIHRWHLKKKDPEAAVSDPVTPITFWIENTTPMALRPTIERAALRWNESFEKAGFSNAVVVKTQPDDADWNAGDIRYNVLRWTSSPNPPFGGYGPSFVNPRTGQILGADIMLEYSYLNRYGLARHLMSEGAALAQPTQTDHALASTYCTLADGLKSELTAARALALVNGDYTSALEEQLINDSLYFLILHEIGHTLGLNHNMKATQLTSVDALFDKKALSESALTGSVMDYPAVNYAPKDREQTAFYSTRPGPYDDWAIRFGYAPEIDDVNARAAHLMRSTERGLAFGNDADDMRAAGKGIDPRVNVFDMSSDAIGYASLRMQQINEALAGLSEKGPTEGESYQATHDAFVQLVRSWSRSASVVSRYVGGVHINRAMAGQPDGGPPYTAVDVETQRRAMSVLSEHVFAPGIADGAAASYRYLAQQRRGFNFFDRNEDPKIHDAMLAVQREVLDHLLHPSVLKRLSDSALYGNQYLLSEAMSDLTDAVFAADARTSVDSVRQNLQIDYVNRLAKILKGDSYDNLSRSMAVYSLQRIADLVGKKRGADLATKAHVAHLELVIETALDAD